MKTILIHYLIMNIQNIFKNEQEKYDKMMKKAREKALKRAVELGALIEEDMELYGSGKKEEQASAGRGAETCA